MCGFHGVKKCSYFEEEPTEVEAKVRKLNNEKAADKDEVIGEMIKDVGYMVVDWIRVCKMAYESGVMPEDWGKGKRIECRNYIHISMVRKYARILVESL